MTDNGHHGRILIALDHDVPSATVLEPVLKIARYRSAPVECVCIEDTRLLEIAAMPQSYMIHTTSHEPSPLDERLMRRAMRVTSVRARERFAATLTQTSVSWSFRIRQAALLSEAFNDATPGDLIVVPLLRGARNAEQVRGLIKASTDRVTASLLVLNETGVPDKSVLAVFDGDRDDLAAAQELAAGFGAPLTVIAFGSNDAEASRFADEAATYLTQSGRQDNVRGIASKDIAKLDQAIRDTAPGTLVLDRASVAIEHLDLIPLLSQSTASLLIRN